MSGTGVDSLPPVEAPVDQQARSSEGSHFILGTAGHIDHGKTLLVKALTGIDADRLPEEQRRGMTIDLGFANLSIGSMQFGVVDVPGHERFVRTMVAGATGIDLALLVVAADDSVMPQTIEHVEILNLLGVSRAVVAITKKDVVDDDMVMLVVDEVNELLADTSIANSAICPVSSLTGEGLDELRNAIVNTASQIPNTGMDGPFRMAVDRVFTVQGRGTVVTGSILSGAVSAGETLEVLPSGDACRVRELQSHGSLESRLANGQRAALNISGIDRDQIARGMELATPGFLEPSKIFGVRLQHLGSGSRGLKSTSTVRIAMGTREVSTRVVLADRTVLEPGDWCYAQLRSGDSQVATYGQRFIIRDEAATRTIGGGVILQPHVARRGLKFSTQSGSFAALDRGEKLDRIEQAHRQAAFTGLSKLQVYARTGVRDDDQEALEDELRRANRLINLEGHDQLISTSTIDDIQTRLVAWLERHHKSNPDLPGRHVEAVTGRLERLAKRGLGRPLLDRFKKNGTIKVLGQFACLEAFAPQLSGADEKLLKAMIEEIRAGEFSPPTLDTLTVAKQADKKRWNKLSTLAVALGELVQIDGKMYLHSESERQLKMAVQGLIESGDGVTVSQAREALGSSRKYVVPFMEHLDRIGFTRRIGDRRVLVESSKE